MGLHLFFYLYKMFLKWNFESNYNQKKNQKIKKCEVVAMGPSYPENVTSLQVQTFTSGKASVFVYIGLLGMF